MFDFDKYDKSSVLYSKQKKGDSPIQLLKMLQQVEEVREERIGENEMVKQLYNRTVKAIFKHKLGMHLN